MKKFLLAGAALAALASGAQAADLGVQRVAVPAAIVSPVFNWTGFYVGGYVGGSSRQSRFTDVNGYNLAGESWNVNRTSFLGGLTAGYNWQLTPSFLLGVEAEVGYLGGARRAQPSSAGLDTTGRINDSVYGLLTARAGFTVDRALFFVKGGLALGGGSLRISDTCTAAPCGPGTLAGSRSTDFGWTIGGGVEYAVAQNWTIKGEYNYVRFNNRTINAVSGANAAFAYGVSNNDAHLFKVGVNYLFSTGPGAVTRY
ncbi:MAG: porin family protein [Rhizobiales bacterium]|nr:porin family protein [Hyphomicrobiales bacterium]